MLRYQLPDSTPEERAQVDAEFREVSAALAQLSVRAARVALRVERTGTHRHLGASSIADYAERRGMSAHNARKFLSLGLALEAQPSVATEVESGTLAVDSAALLGEITREPKAFFRPDDQWPEWARALPTRQFRRLVEHRRDETRAATEVTQVTAFVTLPVKEMLDRTCDLTSRSAHVRLTLGQTLGVVVEDWLDRHDVLRRPAGTRRLPDTATIPDSRTVPADVDRQVRSRSGDRCIVPFCDNGTWVHRSHRVPHAEGGSREADGLDLLCDYHHLLYEKGLIRITGPADAPQVTDSGGRAMDARIPFPESVPRTAARGPGPPQSEDRTGQSDAARSSRRARRSPRSQGSSHPPARPPPRPPQPGAREPSQNEP